MSDDQGKAGPFSFDPAGRQRARGFYSTTHPESGTRCQIRVVETAETIGSAAEWSAVFVLQQQVGKAPGSAWFPVLDHGVEGGRVHAVFPDWRRTLAEELSEGYRANDSEVQALAQALVAALAQLQTLGNRVHGALRPDAVLFPEGAGGHDSLQPRVTGLIPLEDTDPLRRDHDRRAVGYLLHGYIVGAETNFRGDPEFGSAWDEAPLKRKGPWKKFIGELTSGTLDSAPYEELGKRVRNLGQGSRAPMLAGGLVLALAAIGAGIFFARRQIIVTPPPGDNPPWLASLANLTPTQQTALGIPDPRPPKNWKEATNGIATWWKNGVPAHPADLWLPVFYQNPQGPRFDANLGGDVVAELQRRSVDYPNSIRAIRNRQESIPGELASWARDKDLVWGYDPLDSLIRELALNRVANEVRKSPRRDWASEGDSQACQQAYDAARDQVIRDLAGPPYQVVGPDKFVGWKSLLPKQKDQAFGELLRPEFATNIAVWAQKFKLPPDPKPEVPKTDVPKVPEISSPGWLLGFAGMPEPHRVALNLQAPLQATNWAAVSNRVSDWWNKEIPARPSDLWLAIAFPESRLPRFSTNLGGYVSDEFQRRQAYSNTVSALRIRQEAVPSALADWARNQKLVWGHGPLDSLIQNLGLNLVANEVRKARLVNWKPDGDPKSYGNVYDTARETVVGNLTGPPYQVVGPDKFEGWNALSPEDQGRAFTRLLQPDWATNVAVWARGPTIGKPDFATVEKNLGNLGGLQQKAGTNPVAKTVDLPGLNQALVDLKTGMKRRQKPDMTGDLAALDEKIRTNTVKLQKAIDDEGIQKTQDAIRQKQMADQQKDADALRLAQAGARSDLAGAIKGLQQSWPAGSTEGFEKSRAFLPLLTAALDWVGQNDPGKPEWKPDSYKNPETQAWYKDLGEVTQVKEAKSWSEKAKADWMRARDACMGMAAIDSSTRLNELKGQLESAVLGNKEDFREDRARLGKYLDDIGEFSRLNKENAGVADLGKAILMADQKQDLAYFKKERPGLDAKLAAAKERERVEAGAKELEGKLAGIRENFKKVQTPLVDFAKDGVKYTLKVGINRVASGQAVKKLNEFTKELQGIDPDLKKVGRDDGGLKKLITELIGKLDAVKDND